MFNAEYPMVRCLEANGYDVSYSTGVDTDRRGALLQQPQDLPVGRPRRVLVGQPARQRRGGPRRRRQPRLLQRQRGLLEDPLGEQHRRLGHAVPHAGHLQGDARQRQDRPADPPTWTGTWRDPRFSPPADGGRPENALTGTIFTVNCRHDRTIQVPAADGKLRFWRNTTRRHPGRRRHRRRLAAGTLGYEWDEDLDNGFRPAGPDRPVHRRRRRTSQVLHDYGIDLRHRHRHPPPDAVPGAERRARLRRRHGPVVVGPRRQPRPRLRRRRRAPMQQATVNLLADMGAQPATLQAGLRAATASTDTTAPTVDDHRRRPPARPCRPAPPVTVTGTATDTGGGVVGGVEVSTDGGTTWHPATGRGILDLHLDAGGAGPRHDQGPGRRRQRATSAPPAPVHGAPSAPGPARARIWSPTAAPPAAADPDAARDRARRQVPLRRRRLRSPASASTRAAGNTGTHVGHLWTATGHAAGHGDLHRRDRHRLAAGDVLAARSRSRPNTTYVASYFAPNGHYAGDDRLLRAAATDAPPLHALADGADGANGVYGYGAGGGFPTQTFAVRELLGRRRVHAVRRRRRDTTPPTVTSPQPGRRRHRRRHRRRPSRRRSASRCSRLAGR